ncbi:Ubiquitin-like modifier-activating enzyme 6 [Hypsibius exemplaris]|uniref:Ubiquitin-like modifier-activating enzyme 6 n=1 Tax=Hypsibius exemplaris TaxID=2072580 RepID=A0A1W0WNU7_HYPEX|nr:Ubiquitin-like modifier-activating enzyme 6 [Hypsibius exemplaris]
MTSAERDIFKSADTPSTVSSAPSTVSSAPPPPPPTIGSLARQPSVEIDDSLYSRQRYVLGDEAMKRMHKASVLILGLGGLGVEIAKNLILGGVRKVSLWDNRIAQWTDLAGNFYITDEDVRNGVPRVDACVAKLRELNPGVTVEVVSGDPLAPEHLEQIEAHFNCVIATEIPLACRILLNNHVRTRGIPFISGDAMGIFVGAFCDFGDEFLVHDPRAEEGRELLIGHISQAVKGEVTCLEGYLHHLEEGDLVEFKDIRGMTELNGRIVPVEKVVSPLVFAIGDTTRFSEHEQGGLAKQAPKPKTMSFESLEKALRKPNLLTCDLARMNAATECHVAWLALLQFSAKYSRLPRPNDPADIAEALTLASDISKEFDMTDVDAAFLERAFAASSGQFNPLVAAMGGILAQEAMKALTGKWTPLQQWLYIDARDIHASDGTVKNDRYDGIRICVGEQTLEQLKSLNLFMVGCGAIGCEMLKNLALIGAACGPRGLLQITDDDNIEKSNLNRQFLFRPEHITKSKSEVGADRIRHINPDINIKPYMMRVSPATQKAPFTDEFFRKQDIVINALDNVEARKYVDQRCVTTCKPLLDSGTLSTKGHVQVVVPYLTESYGSQRDPVENASDSIPFCTLKQFPALMEHCIEWAREKFQSSFSQKPDSFNNFWQLNGPSAGQLLQTLQGRNHMDGIPLVHKLISAWPKNFTEVVFLARSKFEKYFNHKAQQLLTMFPEDHMLEGGVKFWTSPKRAPTALIFDRDNKLHLAFLRAACHLYGNIYGIPVTKADLAEENLRNLVLTAPVAPFMSKGEEAVIKEAPTAAAVSHTGNEAKQLVHYLQSSMARGDCATGDTMTMHPESFEKDDDSNAHIDYIYAAANLRAAMYKIDQASRLHVKRIAGRIVPAIATTTACVTGLACLELVKLAQDLDKMTLDGKHLLTERVLGRYKNTFLNLALPVIYFSEPGAAARTNLPGGISVTLWDQWTITGNPAFTMQNFIDAVKAKYNVTVSSILLGSKMVYMPFMPGHGKRLGQTFSTYLDLPDSEDYLDLSVDMETDSNMDGDGGDGDMVLWPPIRYYFR